MGTGYTRQSAAEIQTGEVVEAAPLNAEFNQLQNAFDGTTGHTHDGTVGEGPKINLTNSVVGVLPVANGGSGGINKVNATTAPTANDDANDGYSEGSLWIDITGDVIYLCVDATPTAAIWQRYQLYDAGLTSIAGLTTAADRMIYTTASDTYAVTTLTSFARTILDDADAATVRTTISAQTLDSTLTALAAYNTNGLLTQTAADTFAGRTLTGTANEVTVTNGNGVSGNPTISLPAALTFTGKTITGGTFTGGTFTGIGITSGTITGITDLAIADGGTGASDAATARTNLGLVIGTDVQAQDAELSAIAGLVSAADRLPYFTGSGTAALATFTAAGRALVDDADATAQRTTLGVDVAAVYSSKSGNYTALGTDNNGIMRFTATATLSLTAAATLGANWHLSVIADGGDVTIDPNGAETIDGSTTIVVRNGRRVTMVCSGSAFYTVADGGFITPWVSYTPTFVGIGTATSILVRSRRIGSNLEVEGTWTNGTPTATPFSMSLGFNGVNGSGLCDTFWNSRRPILGLVGWNVTSGDNLCIIGLGNSNLVNISIASSSRDSFTPVDGTVLGTGTVMNTRFSVPIEGWN